MGISWGTLVRMLRNLGNFKEFQRNLIVFGIIWGIFVQYETIRLSVAIMEFLDNFGHFETILGNQSNLGQFETIWSNLRQFIANWEFLENF